MSISSADLIARLIKAGTPADLVADVAMELGRAARLLDAEADRELRSEQRAQHVRDLAAARQRKHRIEASSRLSRVTCVTERDERDADPAPNKRPPYPQKLTPTPGVCVAPTREDPISVPISVQVLGAELAAGMVLAWAADRWRREATTRIADRWNAMAGRVGLPPVKKLTEERRSRIKARIGEHGEEAFTEAIAAVERSSFCRGASENGWRANFDFLLQPSSFTKLIEGAYDRSASSNSGQPRAGRRYRDPLLQSEFEAGVLHS